VPKQPWGEERSNVIKSSVLRGKEGGTANLRRNSWDTEQATRGLPTGGAKDLNPVKLGRNPLEEGGSWRRTMSGGGLPLGNKTRQETHPSYPGCCAESG